MIEPAGMFDPLPNGHARADGSESDTPRWRPITPVPEDVTKVIPRHRLGQPSAVWEYLDAEGRLIFRVARWDHEGGKTISPLTFCENAQGEREWRWQSLPKPRPLYGLDRLAARPDAPVLPVEGEKAADAAAALFPDYVVITSPNGAESADCADWSPVSGRHLVIWPDNDSKGRTYADEVARLAVQAGAKSVRIVAVPSEWPEKWDLADAAPKGITVEILRGMLDDARGVHKASDDADLAEMNARYAVVRVGGKTRVVSFEESPAHPGCKVPVYSPFGDFCAFYANPRKTILVDGNKSREVGIGSWWIRQPKRRQYDGIVYAPGADARSTFGKLNLWTGFGCKPVKGNCNLYLAHLRDNVCSGVEELSEYLLNWMACAVHFPGHPGEVAVVLRGNEGVGKGVLAKEFGRLFGQHFRHISQARHLTGRFNSHLQHCSFLFADEAFFAGDRSHELILKALITEDMIMIEPKGLDAFSVRNYLHLILSSNNDWVAPAGADARRFFAVTVSDARKQDHAYFAITKQMDAGEREALLDHLLSRDLSDFDVRKVPLTDALAEQKAHSRRGVDSLVEIIAHRGTLPAVHAQHSHVAVTSGEEDGNGFYPKARLLASDLKNVSSVRIQATLKKDWGCKPWKSGYDRGIEFPPLKDLRDAFDKKHGKQTWPTYDNEAEQDWGRP